MSDTETRASCHLDANTRHDLIENFYDTALGVGDGFGHSFSFADSRLFGVRDFVDLSSADAIADLILADSHLGILVLSDERGRLFGGNGARISVSVPEPSTGVLFGMALMGIWAVSRKRSLHVNGSPTRSWC